jgi:hypothetical protein
MCVHDSYNIFIRRLQCRRYVDIQSVNCMMWSAVVRVSIELVDSVHSKVHQQLLTVLESMSVDIPRVLRCSVLRITGR